MSQLRTLLVQLLNSSFELPVSHPNTILLPVAIQTLLLSGIVSAVEVLFDELLEQHLFQQLYTVTSIILGLRNSLVANWDVCSQPPAHQQLYWTIP